MSQGKQIKYENLRDLLLYLSQITSSQFTEVLQNIERQMLSLHGDNQVQMAMMRDSLNAQATTLAALHMRVADPTFAGLSITEAVEKITILSQNEAEQEQPALVIPR